MSGIEYFPRQEGFVTQNEAALVGLFGALEIPEQWTTDMPALIDRTQPWAKGDHHNPLHEMSEDGLQRGLVEARFRDLDMVDEIVPVGGVYDQIIILGGMMSTNDRRTKFLKDQLDRPFDPVQLAPGGQIFYWAGPRRSQEGELADIERLRMSVRMRHKAADALTGGQVMTRKDPWFVQLDGRQSAEAVVDEAAQARLSLLMHLGDAAMTSQRSYLRSTMVGGQPLWLPSVSHRGFGGTNEIGSRDQIIVTSGVPVPRDGLNGEARHTTLSCAEEWQQRYAPTFEGARVLFVSSNPYVRRTAAEVQQVLTAAGSTIELVSCGPAAPDDTPVQRYLGELARTIYFFRD